MMTDNAAPTPETDAAASLPANDYGSEIVRADFARKLERQRDEARAALLAMGERLEVDFAWDARGRKVPFPAGAPDGIDCRDETIKLLEANNERLHRTIEAAWSTLGGREQHWVEHLDRDGTPRRDQLTLPGALLFLMQRIEDLESK